METCFLPKKFLRRPDCQHLAIPFIKVRHCQMLKARYFQGKSWCALWTIHLRFFLWCQRPKLSVLPISFTILHLGGWSLKWPSANKYRCPSPCRTAGAHTNTHYLTIPAPGLCWSLGLYPQCYTAPKQLSKHKFASPRNTKASQPTWRLLVIEKWALIKLLGPLQYLLSSCFILYITLAMSSITYIHCLPVLETLPYRN